MCFGLASRSHTVLATRRARMYVICLSLEEKVVARVYVRHMFFVPGGKVVTDDIKDPGKS